MIPSVLAERDPYDYDSVAEMVLATLDINDMPTKVPARHPARFFNSVENGQDGMPPWKDVLKPDDIEAIWAYVRTGGKAP